MSKTYFCGICNTKPDQISHHKLHLDSQKHKDKKELFELKLYKLSEEELMNKYNTTNINDIITETETGLYSQLKNKLNCSLTNEVTIKTKMEHSTETKDIKEYTSITNKEALKDKIHEIHNFIRNSGAGYGMNALKLFNIIYGLKKIEENGLLDKVNLKRPECEFSYLLQLANQNDNERVAELIFGVILRSIATSELRQYLFVQIPRDIRGEVFTHLIKEIETITTIEKSCNVLLSGKIYEYFIGRDATAISELGAYFTDRHIVEFILNKLDPTINEDGTIPTMIDMFGGSGGFTTGYINHFKNKYDGIHWDTELDKIYHYDINEDVIRSAGLELFCLTGRFPNKDNVGYLNAFKNEFSDKKYKYPITNPPYGGDKLNTSNAQIKLNKIKEFIKNELKDNKDEGLRIRRQKQLKDIELQERKDKQDQEKAKVSIDTCSQRLKKFALDNKQFSSDKKKLKGNDKESCSLMLLMDIVEAGGTAIGVLKEGVFFNKTYKDIRNCLVQNYNVREVISVPQDQFENTSTKTSIIIFDNTEEKTSVVKFSDLTVIRYEEDKFVEIDGEIVVVENKGDIKEVIDTLVTTATIDEIIDNDIMSLNSKDYMNKKQSISCGKEFKLVKIGDICESQNGYAFKTSEYKNEGIPLISITHIKNHKLIFNNCNFIEYNDKYEKFEIKKKDLIITLTGKKPNLVNIGLNEKNDVLYLNQRCAILRNFKKINYYYFLAIFDGFLYDYINKHIGNGSNQENVSLSEILNLQIPIPTSEKKIQYWVDKISTPYIERNEKQSRIKELELFVQQQIQYIEEHEDCEEVELGSICMFESGKFNSSDCKSVGLYPFYNGKAIQPDGFSDKFCYDNQAYLILIKDGGAGIGKYGEHIGLGNVFYVTGKSGFTSHQVAITLINANIISIKYLLYVLKHNKNNIMDLAKYSTGLGTITKTDLQKFKIKIPKNKKLIDNLNPSFDKLNQLQNEVKIADELYKRYIQELNNEALPK